MTRLYHVPLSPFCRKVRLCLAEKKIEVELIEERYWERDPDFLRRNPAGKVPILRMDGRTLTRKPGDLRIPRGDASRPAADAARPGGRATRCGG